MAPGLRVPLCVSLIVGYAVATVQTMLAPRPMTALAYDSGGVTTSTVTVPLVTALDGLATVRDLVLRSFGPDASAGT